MKTVIFHLVVENMMLKAAAKGGRIKKAAYCSAKRGLNCEP
jgi:hypothetical protein